MVCRNKHTSEYIKTRSGSNGITYEFYLYSKCGHEIEVMVFAHNHHRGVIALNTPLITSTLYDSNILY